MFTKFTQYVAYAKKAVIQVTGLIAALLALGLLPDPYSDWAAAALGILTTITHYLATNGPAPTPADPEQPAAGVPPNV